MLLIAALAAVLTALLTAVGEVVMRIAVRSATPLAVSFFVVALQWVLYTSLLLVTGGFSDFSSSGVGWFLLTGLLNPFLYLVFYLLAARLIGVSRSSPLKGIAPILSVIAAAAALDERLTPVQYTAIGMVVAGAITISTEGRMKESGEPRGARLGDRKLPAVGFVFALLSGAAIGLASVLFKVSLIRMPSPLLGSWVCITEALFLIPLAGFLFPSGDRFQMSRASVPWTLIGGVINAAAFYGLLYSISLERVSIVFTLIMASPLFVLIISILFLRHIERVTWKVVAGAVLTVLGGVLVSVA